MKVCPGIFRTGLDLYESDSFDLRRRSRKGQVSFNSQSCKLGVESQPGRHCFYRLVRKGLRVCNGVLLHTLNPTVNKKTNAGLPLQAVAWRLLFLQAT